MIPYLHLGPLELPTFGLMVALALIASAYVLQADFDRRGMNADAFTMITVAGLAGIFGAKLYHLLETPAEFFAHSGTSLVEPLWIRVVRRIPRRFRGYAVDGMAGEIKDLGISGCVFAGSFDWIWNRADWMLSFGRRGLREADLAALGDEFSKWNCADDGTGASHAPV